MRTFDQLYIGSAWAEPATTERLTIRSPATGDRRRHRLRMPPPPMSISPSPQPAAAFDTGPWPRMTVAERVDGA